MKLLLLAASLLLTVSAAPRDESLLSEWAHYKADHQKVYETPEEDSRRLKTYIENKKIVEEHNRKYQRGETTYSVGINKFSDWFPEELDRLNGLKVDKSRVGGKMFELAPGTHVPDSINWVEKGAVTSVKDQKNCGSCYAFSAVGALEGLMFRTNKTITDLSTQELVDCSGAEGNGGCGGGYMTQCFSYVKKRGGIDSDKSYPYDAQEHECRAEDGKIAASCTSYKYIMADEESLKAAVGTVGPVSIAFGVHRDFFKYKGGIYAGNCADFGNHGMVVVGYGTDNETRFDYWLVKNSWGVNWGEKGYARIIRNENQCGIADAASYPAYKN